MRKSSIEEEWLLRLSNLLNGISLISCRHCEALDGSSMEEKCLLRRGNLFIMRVRLKPKKIATSPRKII